MNHAKKLPTFYLQLLTLLMQLFSFVCLLFCFAFAITHLSLLALSVLSRALQAAESPCPKPQAHISFWCLGMTEQLTQNLIYLRWEGEREATS